MKLPTSLPKPKKPRLFLIRRVMGDSMLPTLKPGKLVLGLRPRRLQTGDIVIIRHNQLEKIKRIQDIAPGKLFLVGDNPGSSTDSRDFGWVDTEAVIAKISWF